MIQVSVTIAHGKIVCNRQAIRDLIAGQKDGPYTLTLKPTKAQRSLDQNAYWWAVPVEILAEHCGYTPAQMHYALLGECFGYTPGPTGHPVPNVPSSSELNTAEFTKLIDWVLTWAPTELGVVIPAPDERAA